MFILLTFIQQSTASSKPLSSSYSTLHHQPLSFTSIFVSSSFDFPFPLMGLLTSVVNGVQIRLTNDSLAVDKCPWKVLGILYLALYLPVEQGNIDLEHCEKASNVLYCGKLNDGHWITNKQFRSNLFEKVCCSIQLQVWNFLFGFESALKIILSIRTWGSKKFSQSDAQSVSSFVQCFVNESVICQAPNDKLLNMWALWKSSSPYLGLLIKLSSFWKSKAVASTFDVVRT